MPKAEQLRVRRPDDTLVKVRRGQTVLRFQAQPVGQERDVVQLAGAQDDCIDMRACAVPEAGGIPLDLFQRRHFFAVLRPGMAHHRRAVRLGHRLAVFAALRSDVFGRIGGADNQDVPARKFARIAEVMACRVRPLKVSKPGNPVTFGVQKWPDATTTWSNSSEQTWWFFRSWTVPVNLPVAASWALCGTGVRDQIRGAHPGPLCPAFDTAEQHRAGRTAAHLFPEMRLGGVIGKFQPFLRAFRPKAAGSRAMGRFAKFIQAGPPGAVPKHAPVVLLFESHDPGDFGTLWHRRLESPQLHQSRRPRPDHRCPFRHVIPPPCGGQGAAPLVKRWRGTARIVR
jgi:hypothetical protein